MIKNKINKLYEQAWEQFGTEKQLVVAMEECSELIKELSKAIRGNSNEMNIAEEIADVEIMTEQIKEHFGLQTVVKGFKVEKQRRLRERIKAMKHGK